jgi:hypothetical protein
MTRCRFILSAPTRLAQPLRPNRLVLSAPTRPTNHAIRMKAGSNLLRVDPPSTRRATVAPYRQGPIADSVPTATALSP